MRKKKISELYHYALFEFKINGEEDNIHIKDVDKLLAIKHADGKNDFHELYVGDRIIIENKKYIIDKIRIDDLFDRVLDFEHENWLFRVFVNITEIS